MDILDVCDPTPDGFRYILVIADYFSKCVVRQATGHTVVRQATGHTVGIQKDSNAPIIFIHVDDLKLCPAPADTA